MNVSKILMWKIFGNVISLVFKETFEDVYTSKSLMRNWYLVAGNHDHNGNVTAQIEYTNRTQRW